MFTFHTDWHLLLFLFEHRFVINQSGHVVSAATAEIVLIWTTHLGQTWSLTLMPFSATETFHPPFSPPSLIPKSRGQWLPRHLSTLHSPHWKLKGCIKPFVWALNCYSSAHHLSQPEDMGLTSPRLTFLNNLCLVKSTWAHHLWGRGEGHWGRERRKACDEDMGRTGQMASYIFNIAAIDFRCSPWERQNVRCTVWVLSTSVCV